jgi:Domain of unknown function (DUF4331)
MSHHLSGPNLRSPAGDARLDLTDVFAFPAPGGYRTVLIMNVNPDFGGFADAFHPGAVYRIDVDTDADDRADVAFSIVFSDPADGAQTFTVYRATGEQARAPEAAGEGIITGAPVSFGPEPQVVQSGPYRGFAGRRSDPFFADLAGILDNFQWTGADALADRDVFGIVLELPADDWDTYAKAWTAVLEHAGGYSVEEAEQALRTVLPDVLRYDRDRPAAYPNGRTLSDDVLDARLAMLTNGKVPGDHIGPHTDLLPDFPYLGNPHGRTS